ncbi:saccharopine dehydrogenase family protein [Nocardioides jejuensis]|uniref:Saccharopine dehydrogenase n=1 Tax=Nocardioides jejuensis TaxID=2502782 RepID=A0A4R1CI27_9ACTN|nr:saccharopine dehydrogenase NADP-binding domain-containing protein [Nocardioides jejuensis]TCJ30641.1 saccharopine dehydrogenase [Nocardioides jejuensis]
MTGTIVVFGATGYAGELAVRSLLRRGVKPVVAGKTESRIKAAAEKFGGLEYRLADAADVGSLRALVGAGDVLMTTVGPFDQVGYNAAQAAADEGAHYIDSTGEVGFVHDLRERHDLRARETGATMLPAFGNDYVPGFLAGAIAIERAGAQIASLDIGYFIDGSLRGGKGLSHGTRTTVAEGMTLPVTLWHDRTLVDRRAASKVKTFTISGHRKAAVLATGTEVLFLPREYPQLASVTVYNGWFPEMSRVLPLVTAVATTVARTDRGARAVDKVLAKTVGPTGGPDAAERARTGAHTVAIARNAAGKAVSEVHVVGPNVYDLTAELMAWAGIELVNGRASSAGVVGPTEAFGLEVLTRACADIGLVVA